MSAPHLVFRKINSRILESGKTRLLQNLTGILPVLAFPLLWAGASALLKTPLLPGPHTVIRHLAGSSRWVPHLIASLGRIGAGMTLAVLAGIPLGILAAGKGLPARAVSALGSLAYPVPKIVLLPLLVILLGVGETPKILLIFLVLFFPLLTAVRDGTRALPAAYFDALVSLGIRRGRSFPGWFAVRRVILPGILPGVLSSLRISLGIAVAVLFFAENFGTTRGMGHFIMDSRIRVHYKDLYGGILALSFSVLVLFLILDGLEQRLSPRYGQDLS